MGTPVLESWPSACGGGADRTNVRAARSMPPVGVGPDGAGLPDGAGWPEIAAEARTWVGTPAVWQGRIKGVGTDCKGLVAGVAAACGRPEADSVEALAGDYGFKVDPMRLLGGVRRLFSPIAAVVPGAVLVIRLSGRAVHLGIALDAERLVHCYVRGPRCVIEGRIAGLEVDSVWGWRHVS